MKKMYLMKGMAVLALGLVVASCNKMDFDQDAYQKAKEAESRQKFINNVMGGQDIDPNQTWSTTKSVSITVTPQKDGILKIYAANPIGNIVAPLYTTTAVAGKETTFTVTRPADVEMLYATVLNEDGLIADLLAFNATEASAIVDMTDDTTTRSISRRAASAPTAPGYDQTNPIPVPAAPTDLPTSANANIKIENNTTTEWGYDGQTVFIAENVTLTITQQWGRAGSKVYMSKGSKIVNTSGTLYMSGSYIYNDGGTIEGGLLLDNNSVIWNKGTIDTKDANINYQNDNSLIYNSGMITAKNFTVGQNGRLWNEGTVTATGTLKGYNSNAKIYNAAGCNMNAAVFELDNSSQYFWNEGTLTVSGAFKTTNSAAATTVNNGTIYAGSFDGSAGAHFFNANDAIVVISGETAITNSNTVWVNDGTYTSGTFKVTAGGNQVFNNCRLTVTGKFSMGNYDGSRFVLNGHASVICDEFDWNGDNYFWLGGGSLLKVTKTLKSNNINSDKGFFNTTSEYAVISAKAITTDNPNGQWRAWYEGKIYVDTDEHFALIKINDGQSNMKLADGALLTGKQGTAPIEWGESTCRPEYKGKKKDPDPVMYYYYAFEDLGAIGDFDFNDVVLRVSAPNNGESTVYLMAAGGTLKSKVVYGDQTLCNEVHEAFEVELGGGNFDMVNTGYTKRDFVSLGTVTIAEGADMANLPFGIVVTGNNGESVKVTREVDHKGTAPLMIVVNGYPEGEDAGKWFWAKERVNISVAYPEFGAWGADVQTNQNWYQNYVDG
jgi:hypothetical protein